MWKIENNANDKSMLPVEYIYIYLHICDVLENIGLPRKFKRWLQPPQ